MKVWGSSCWSWIWKSRGQDETTFGGRKGEDKWWTRSMWVMRKTVWRWGECRRSSGQGAWTLGNTWGNPRCEVLSHDSRAVVLCASLEATWGDLFLLWSCCDLSQHRLFQSHHLKSVFPALICDSTFSSVQSLSRVRLFATPWTAARQASLSITNSWSQPHSCPLSSWCHPAISSSVVPFSSLPESLPASGSFPMSQLFTWGGQSTGVSALASFLPKNTQGWSPSEWTGWISL